jgi:hypothetical protein
LGKRAMKYYIEAKRGGQVLREHSRVCDDCNCDEVLASVVLAVKGAAEKITVYTHEGLHNSHTIKEVTRIVLPEA